MSTCQATLLECDQCGRQLIRDVRASAMRRWAVKDLDWDCDGNDLCPECK